MIATTLSSNKLSLTSNGTRATQVEGVCQLFPVDVIQGYQHMKVDCRWDQIFGDYRLLGPKGELPEDLAGPGSAPPTNSRGQSLLSCWIRRNVKLNRTQIFGRLSTTARISIPSV